MQTYILRRLALSVPTLLIVSFVTFALVNLMPGNIVENQLLEAPAISRTDIKAVEHRLGLDQPAWKRYFQWLGGTAHGDLGRSLWTSRPVAAEIGNRLPITVELAIIAFSISTVVAISVGVLAAVRQNSPLDYGLRFLSIAGLSIPGFWIGTLFIVLGAKYFHYLPSLTFIPLTKSVPGNLKQFLPPAIILSLALSAGLIRITRSSLLEVLRQDYIRTAWAKGFRGRRVLFRHALRNALIPVITIMGSQLAALLGGSVIFESIFNLPGLGNLLFVSVQQRDLIVVQSLALLLGTALVLINLTVDVAYGWIDPRITF